MTIPAGFVPIDEVPKADTEISTEGGIPEGFIPQESMDKVDDRTFKEKGQALGQHFGRTIISQGVAFPKTMADLVKYGSQYFAQKGIEQQLKQEKAIEPEDLKFTQSVLTAMGFPSELLDKIGYPNAEDFEQGLINFIEKIGGAKQTPIKTDIPRERVARGVGGTIGMSIPGSLASLPARMMYGGIAGAAGSLAEEAGAGTKGQMAAAFGIPALVNVAAQIAQKKFRPSTAQLESLKNFGETLGLNAEELTTLLQTDTKQAGLGKIAAPTQKSAAILESASTKLGAAYESIKGSAKQLPEATRKQTVKFINTLEGVVENLKVSSMPGDDKLAAIKKIETAMFDFAEKGVTPEGLIATYQDVGQAVNWNAFRGGKKDLAKIQQPIKDTIREIDPKLSVNFENLNQLYGKFKKIEKTLGPNMFKKVMDYGEYFGLLGGMVKAAGDFSAEGAMKVMTGFLGVKLSRRLATKLLTDPKYQNILIKATKAIKTGSRASGRKVYRELRDQVVNDFPEESKDVNWKKLDKDKALDRKG